MSAAEGATSTQGTVFRMDSAGNTVWSKAPYPNSLKHWLATDGVNLYVGHAQYLYMYDTDDGTLKQTINNVPKDNYDSIGYTSTDNFGSVWVHNVYNSTAPAPLTRFELREP